MVACGCKGYRSTKCVAMNMNKMNKKSYKAEEKNKKEKR